MPRTTVVVGGAAQTVIRTVSKEDTREGCDNTPYAVPLDADPVKTGEILKNGSSAQTSSDRVVLGCEPVGAADDKCGEVGDRVAAALRGFEEEQRAIADAEYAQQIEQLTALNDKLLARHTQFRKDAEEMTAVLKEQIADIRRQLDAETEQKKMLQTIIDNHERIHSIQTKAKEIQKASSQEQKYRRLSQGKSATQQQ